MSMALPWKTNKPSIAVSGIDVVNESEVDESRDRNQKVLIFGFSLDSDCVREREEEKLVTCNSTEKEYFIVERDQRSNLEEKELKTIVNGSQLDECSDRDKKALVFGVPLSVFDAVDSLKEKKEAEEVFNGDSKDQRGDPIVERDCVHKDDSFAVQKLELEEDQKVKIEGKEEKNMSTDVEFIDRNHEAIILEVSNTNVDGEKEGEEINHFNSIDLGLISCEPEHCDAVQKVQLQEDGKVQVEEKDEKTKNLDVSNVHFDTNGVEEKAKEGAYGFSTQKGDSVVEREDAKKDDSFAAVETYENKNTDEDLDSNSLETQANVKTRIPRTLKTNVFKGGSEHENLSEESKEGYAHHLASSTPVKASGIKSGNRAGGRPPKNHKNLSKQTKDRDVHHLATSTLVASSVNSGKRPRGRPRKTLKPESTKGDVHHLPNQRTLSSIHNLSLNEILTQLYSVAIDPMKIDSSLPMTTSFFTDFRGFHSSNSSENQDPVKSMGKKRGRKNKVMKSEPKLDCKQDYWSDITLESSPERESVASRGRKRQGNFPKKRQNKKAKPVGKPLLSVSLNPSWDTKHTNDKQEVEGERVLSNYAEKNKEETRTALILTFDDSDAIPTVINLIKIFSRFGPLSEEETEILRKTGRAKVVFKYCDDAEKAFSSAGKYSIFGPALVSFRLRYSLLPKSSPVTYRKEFRNDATLQDQQGNWQYVS